MKSSQERNDDLWISANMVSYFTEYSMKMKEMLLSQMFVWEVGPAT